MADGEFSLAKFDERRRNKYLGLLRQGGGRHESARASGVSHELVRQYRLRHPEFALAEDLAQEESSDRVENALFKAAVRGNVVACQVWLYNRRPAKWKDQRNLKVSVADDDIDSAIEAELARLAGRGQAENAGPPPLGHAGNGAAGPA